jgi:RNA polymerase sigma factor (sigma-70 family)
MGVDLVPDERLIARVRAGDMRAFETIYDRYERPIRTFCRHLLGQPEDADDAVQHAFLAAYRTITGSDQRLDLKPWLFTVARNRCRSLLRSRRRDPGLTGEAFEPSTEGLVAAVERRESLRHMLADIAALPEDQRAALILTQLETLKHDEVARVLEVPTDKVKALVFQARTSLMHAREARDTACGEIREQLATASGAALRRGNLKRHLRMCTGCRDFEVALRRQHSVILLLLPVAARPALRGKVLGEIAGGGSGAAAAGSGAGVGTTAGGLLAKGAVLKLAAVAAVTAAGAGVGVAGPGSVAALARDALHVDNAGNRAVARVGDHAHVNGGTRTVSLRPGNRHTKGGRSGFVPGSTSPTSHDKASAGGGGSPARQHTAVTPLSLSESSHGGGNEQPASGGGKPDSPPGLPGGGTPPGLGKKGGTPPGLGKKGGSPPGLGNKPSSTPPGPSGDKGGSLTPPASTKAPLSTGSPAAGAAPGGPPAGAGPPDAPGPGSGSGGGDGNGNGNGGGHGAGP